MSKAQTSAGAVLLGGAIGTVTAWAFTQATGIEVPQEVAGAWATICGAAAAKAHLA